MSQDNLQPPKACPACGSKELTTSATVTATSYWRCLTCGEVWNEKRLGANRYSPRRW